METHDRGMTEAKKRPMPLEETEEVLPQASRLFLSV